MRKSSFGAFGALAAAAALVLSQAAAADARGPREIRIEDRCDEESFNAAVGPDTCAPVVDDPVTFDEVLEELNPDDFGHGAWRFNSDSLGARPGEHIHVHNTGGEAHTFTRVAELGGGCVPDLNIPLGLEPVAECASDTPAPPPIFFETLLAPGWSLDVVAPTQPGTYTYMCLIHPWMFSTVKVRR
jgi:plastocyanin